MSLELREEIKKNTYVNFLSIFLLFFSILHSSLCLSFLCQGMVYSAEYIKKKLEQEMILSQAFGRDLVRCSARRVTTPSLSS